MCSRSNVHAGRIEQALLFSSDHRGFVVNERKQPPAEASRIESQGHRTWHLAPEDSWSVQRTGTVYVPERFAEEGFIHCTDSIQEVLAVGNRYYRSDPRPYLLLEIDCDSVDALVVYEDAARIFPHIYGYLPISAIVDIMTVDRDQDGQFLAVRTREQRDE